MDPAPEAPEPPRPSRPGLDAATARRLLEDAITTPDPGTGSFFWTPPEVEELCRLLPEYGISRMIGRGGMGAVYQGTDPALDRPVAIKILPAELSCLAGFADRFRREAWALAQLKHPHIVQIYQFGTTPGGHLYFVMEYVAGSNLAEQLDRRKQEKPDQPPFKPGEVLKIAGQVCAALSGAHSKGILHRDIKPANLLMDDAGHLKLVDFGLARPVDPGPKDSGVTATHTMIGTRDYMAPELLDGHDTDPRADVYAVGVLMYEMLTGMVPRGAFLPASHFQPVDRRLDQLIVHAMQADRTRRLASIGAMQAELEAIQSGGGLPRRSWRAVAGVVVAGFAAGVVAWHQRSTPGDVPDLPVSSLPARSGLIWEESFDLPPGEFGLGPSSRFTPERQGSGSAVITHEGLEYTDSDGSQLLTRGRAASLDATQLTVSLSYVAALTLPAGPEAELWISLLARQTAGTNYRFFNLCLRAADDTLTPPDGDTSPDEILAVGMRTLKGPQVWQIWDRTTNGAGSRAAVSDTPTTRTTFLLVRLERDAVGLNERATLWVDPPLTRPPEESDGFSYTSEQSDLTQWNELRQVRLGAGYGSGTQLGAAWVVDEIRLGWTREAVTPVKRP